MSVIDIFACKLMPLTYGIINYNTTISVAQKRRSILDRSEALD